MSGIHGLFGVYSKRELHQASSAMRGHTGKDTEVNYFSAEVGLSAVGGSSLEAVETDANQKVHVLLDGRLWNRNAVQNPLCKDTTAQGDSNDFIGTLCAGYDIRRFDCPDGSFTLALWNGTVLTLLRDPFGTKPLFYCVLEAQNTIIFATEMKAILRHEKVPREINKDALYQHRLFGHSLGDATLISSIKQVPPGHMLRASMGKDGCLCVKLSEYVQRNDRAVVDISEEEAVSTLYALLQEAIQDCMCLDKNDNMGVLLSGGIDSGILAIIAAQMNLSRLRSYTVTDNPDFADAIRALELADALGIDHQQIVVSFGEFLSELPNCIHCSESFITWVPFFFLIKAAGHSVRSAMNGEPAGLLFSTGHEYVPWHNWRQRLADLSSVDEQFLPQDMVAPANNTLETLLKMERNGVHACQDFFMSHYLPNRCFQGYGLHSAAVNVHLWYPYLNIRLVRFIASLPDSLKVRGNRRKYIMHKMAEKVSPEPRPFSCRNGYSMPKVGLPMSFRNLFRQLVIFCERIISDDIAVRHPYRHFLPAKHMLFLFDLFYLIFIEQGGKRPSNVDVFGLYENSGAGHPLL